MNFRSERVSKLIREQLATIILREAEFPGALMTITEVDVDAKLEYAKVKISVIPSSSADAALAELTGKAGELQHILLKKINIKPMPRISFEIDHGVEHAATIEKIFIEKEIAKEIEKEEIENDEEER